MSGMLLLVRQLEIVWKFFNNSPLKSVNISMKIGFIGIGLMGLPLVERLASNGYSVTVYNRTQSKLQSLTHPQITIADRVSVLVDRSDCIILMLTDDRAIAQVLLNSEILPQLTGKTIVQMGTISPQASVDICDRISQVGGEYLEAPVLGSIPEAKTGKLLIMVGGTRSQFDLYLPLLKIFSESPRLIGNVGTAAALKLGLNQLISALTAGFAQSLAYLQSQDVNIDIFMDILRSSALYAPTFDKKLDRMLDRNYDNPNFPTKHLLKDTNLFIDSAKSAHLNTMPIEGVKKILDRAISLGLAEGDYSALFDAIISIPNEKQ
jgi:3-hydroxyisobutyrate dehydrogenase